MAKRILVTGSGGFIGKHLCAALRNAGDTVIPFDTCDGDVCTAVFEKADHVFHLASLTFVPLSWEKPTEFFRVNHLGTLNVLEYCRKEKCSLTYLSSYVYGTPGYLPVDENHPLSGNTPYNLSKIQAEELCSFYAANFGINITVFRPFNVYGPGQRADFLIPQIIHNVLDDTRAYVEVMSLTPRRDYLYVSDLVAACLKSFEVKGYNVYNLGAGVSYSVEDIIGRVISITGSKKEIRSLNATRKNEIADLYADISKIKNEKNWTPLTGLREGLELTVDWHRHQNLKYT